MIAESVVDGKKETASLNERVKSLKGKHATLEQALLEETNRPLPDSMAIARLKRAKLAIKDEIVRLSEN